jgi:hypothetical protein
MVSVASEVLREYGSLANNVRLIKKSSHDMTVPGDIPEK